jgi:hypothetical protein
MHTKEFSIATRAVVAALLGCAAIYLAMLLVKSHIPAFQWNFNDGFDLGASQKNCDACKKVFYGSFFLSGPISAAAALYFSQRSSGSIALSVIGALLVFTAIHYANLGRFPIAIIVMAIGAGTVHLNRRANSYFPSEKLDTEYSLRVGWVDLLAVMFLAALLIPSNLEAVTAGPLFESHKVSYFVGPALYEYAPGLVPGLDFHSHYGPALGWFFHLIMGDGWKSAAMRSVGLNIAISLAVYVQAYFLLAYLIRSRVASIAIISALAVLAFSTPDHFYSPSAYPTRFPLIIAFVVALGLHCNDPSRRGWLILSALMCAVSLLWQTEIGLFFLVAGTFICAISGGLPNYRNTVFFLVSSILFAAFLCLLLFGRAALSLTFVIECFRPLLIYGTGWGSAPIKWDFNWNIIYNLPLQIVGCITIGWASIRLATTPKTDRDHFITGVLLALSLVGTALMIKWVNRTLDAVWHQNALPLVIVAAWWVRQFSRSWRPVTRTSLGAAAIVATILGLLFVQDSGNPHLYGLRSYAKYPSLLNWRAAPTIAWQEDFQRITETEVKFIQDNTKPDERVLVVAFVDWAYLAQAHRAPKAHFLPLLVSFDERFVDPSFDGPAKLFYDNITETYRDYPRVAGILERIKRDFVAVQTSGNLTLYERRR